MCNKWGLIRTWCRTGTIPYGKRRYRLCSFQMLFITIEVLTPGVNRSDLSDCIAIYDSQIWRYHAIHGSLNTQSSKWKRLNREVYRGYKCNFRDRTVGYYCCTGISSNCVGTLHRKIKFGRKRVMWGATILFTRQFPIYQQILRRNFRWKRWQKIWG